VSLWLIADMTHSDLDRAELEAAKLQVARSSPDKWLYQVKYSYDNKIA